MINKIILEFFIMFFGISIIVLILSKGIFERKKSEKELKKEIELLKKEICR